jgi:anti-sigma factor ChrR (cupin superfamily)
LLLIDTPDYRDVLKFKEQSARLRAALALLSAEERAAIELAFFSELTHAQVAARLKRPSSTVKGWFRSGLHKLRQVDSTNACDQSQAVCAHAIGALPPLEVASIETHLASCWQCRRERDSLRSAVNGFAAWPVDVLRPAASLKKRIASIALAAGKEGIQSAVPGWSAPEWDNVAPGISCKLLATDTERHMVSMLVRLAPGGEYPPHTHAGLEELHLLDGELWIDERKLHAGDYHRAEPGTSDKRVWSETGCTCVLMTSTRDALRD